MAKYFIAAIAVILVAGGGYYWWIMKNDAGAITPTPTPVPQQVATSTYATSSFSIVYPRTFSLDDSYAYDQFEGKPIAGVKFTIPLTMATGTNLSTDTYLSVETLPRANNCSGDIFVVDNVTAQEVTENGMTYSVASTSGAGAGNLYEETVYALKDSKPCTAVRYFIHSTQIANYPAGTVTEFNRSALMDAFDSIRRTLSLTAATTTP